MKRNDCDICGGSGFIRLPVRQKISLRLEDNEPIEPRVNIRQYICPECGDTCPYEKVEIVQAQDFIPCEYLEHGENSDFISYIHQSLAMRIADFIYKEGYITYTIDREEDYYTRAKKITAKCGVLSPRQLKTFEQKVRERQKYIASSLVNDAVKKINNWGSSYGDTTINKSYANRILYELLDKIKE